MPNPTQAVIREGNAHEHWNLDNISWLPHVYDMVMDFSQVSMPTVKAFWDMKEYCTIDRNGNFDIWTTWGGSHPSYMPADSFLFEVNNEGTENRTKMTVTPNLMYVSTGYNAIEETKSAGSMHNLVSDRMIGMNRGLTWVLNYEMWAKQGSPSETAAKVGTSLDLDTLFLDNVGMQGNWAQNAIRLRNFPADVLSRFNSIPFFIRPNLKGHTIQNLSTNGNYFMRSPVYLASGNASGNPQVPDGTFINEDETNPDLMDLLITDTNGRPENPSHKDIDFILDNIQDMGSGFGVLVAVPTAGMSYLRRTLYQRNIGLVSDPVMDYGLNYLRPLIHGGKNCAFYIEPTMDRLWPNSMFFFDPTQLVLTCVDGWGPMVQSWQYLPQTIGAYVMCKVLWMQMFLKNAKAVGALLNCKWN